MWPLLVQQDMSSKFGLIKNVKSGKIKDKQPTHPYFCPQTTLPYTPTPQILTLHTLHTAYLSGRKAQQ